MKKDELIYPKLILGLDISTTCIGISIIFDDGENEPTVELISHVSPKIDKSIKGIEALILRKKIFEEEFLLKIDNYLKNFNTPINKITDCVIESPLVYALGNSNANTISLLLQFNGLLSEGVYNVLGIIPNYVSSHDARMLSFPELLSIRKFNKKGEIYPPKNIEKSIKDNNLILFGSYPFDCDKKSVMMNLIMDKYPNIPWIYDKKNELKKENYDSCDALICALAYSNKIRYGDITPEIIYVNKETINDKTSFEYKVKIWDKIYDKKININ